MSKHCQSVISKKIKDQLSSLLVAKGLTDEQISIKIIDVFMSIDHHVTTEDFVSILKDKGIDLDENIVNSVLDAFVQIGVAKAVEFEGENIKRFEVLHPKEHHDHFVCIKCKKIIEFNDKQLEKIQDAIIANIGGTPLFHKLEIYGVCNNCGIPKEKITPISFIPEGKRVLCKNIDSGGNVKKRLAALGFISKEEIKVIKNSGFGPIVLEIKDSRIAIGRGEAQRIMVEEI